ncbi:MAG: GNAT family N-acetyltransferase [Paracoccaceae bacterium]
MIVRAGTVADAPACAAIVRAWLDATPWMPLGGPSEATLTAMMREGFPRREVWVAEDRDEDHADGPVAGYLSYDPDARHVVGLYAARPGSGAGKALLDRVRRGRDHVWLLSHAPNADAHRFYAREGFEVTARDLPGSDGVPEIRMEWRA